MVLTEEEEEEESDATRRRWEINTKNRRGNRNMESGGRAGKCKEKEFGREMENRYQ